MPITDPNPEHPEDRLLRRLWITLVPLFLGGVLATEHLPYALVTTLIPPYALVVGILACAAYLLVERKKVRRKFEKEDAIELDRLARLRDTLGPTNVINGPVSGSVVQAGRVEGGVHASPPSSAAGR